MVLVCDNGLFLNINDYMSNIESTSTAGTPFFFVIKEKGFIDNIFLVTNDEYIKAKHYVRGFDYETFKKTGKKEHYSVFHAYYKYPNACHVQESHFVYRLNWNEQCCSSSIYFEVH